MKKSNVSLSRLSLPKEMGGRSLSNIMDVFSAAKCKFLFKCIKKEYKNIPCYILLRKMIFNDFKNQSVHNQKFFLFNNNKLIKKKDKSYWDWLSQARIIYDKIDKSSICSPFINGRILNYKNDNCISFNNETSINNYSYCENTIPINSKNKDIKASYSDWFNNVKVIFKNDILSKNNLNLKSILNSVPKKLKWTKKQNIWINEKHIPLPILFTKPLNTITRIEDFRIKFLINFWAKNKKKCHCGMVEKDFSSYHLLFDCQMIIDWENPNQRNIRINNSFNHNSIHYNFSWILNWCIWKTYFQIIYNKKVFDPKSKLEFFIEDNEYTHLKLISSFISTRSTKKRELLMKQIFHFRYFTLFQDKIYHKSYIYK